MLLQMLAIILGVLILYLIIDFLFIHGANINSFGEKWIKRTVWLWLPIYGLQRLIKEVIFKKK